MAPQPHDPARECQRRRHALLALTACATLALLWAGCTSDGLEGPGGLGTVRFAVRWPGASARVIPAATTRIAVSVSGEGIGTAISGEILATDVVGDWGELELAVPPGSARLIEAEALDGSDVVLARGSRTLDVAAGVTTSAVIELVQDLFSGTVTNLHTGAVEPSVTVSVQGRGDDTDASGLYEILGLTSSTERLVVSGASILTRSFPVTTAPLGTQDATCLASDYNTTHMRAEMWDGAHTFRWAPASPPTIVAYRRKYGAGGAIVDVASADWAAIVDVLENELPAISEGFYGGAAQVEYYNGRPEDDPRWTASGDWGYIALHNAVGIAVRDSFSSGAAGLGGCIYYIGQNDLVGGGAVTITGGGGYSDRRHVIRHELGHALGWAHPFEHLDVNAPLMRDSIMNYWNIGHWVLDYSDADRELMRYCMHRGAGNVAPDYDANGYVGYKGLGALAGGVYVDMPDRAVRIDMQVVDGQTSWQGDTRLLGIME